MPCRFNGVRGIVKARRQLCLGLDRAGRRCGLRDTRCNMSTRSRSRLASLACVACITCRCLASRWSSNTLAHRGCFQTYRGRSSVFCKFCASCACPSASAFRMPARARRRLRCALLRSASHERNAVSRRVASSWSCQVDFNLSLCFFWRHSPKKLYGRLRTRVRS